MKIIRLTLFLLIMSPTWLSVSSSVTAQGVQPIELTVSPPVAYLQVTPGKALTHTVTLEYQGNEPVMVSPQLVDFAPGSEGQGMVLESQHTFPYLTQASKQELGETFVMQPKETKRVTVAIAPPVGVPEREYHLTLIFRAQPVVPHQLEGIGGQAVAGIGSNLIIFVSPQTQVTSQLRINSIQTAKVLDTLGRISFKILAENPGLSAAQASGSAIVKNWRGQPVAEYELFPDMVLAQSQRLLRAAEPATPGAEVDLEPAVSHDFVYDPLFMIGPYTIEVFLGSERSTPISTLQIYALPFSAGVAVLIGLVLYGGYLYLRRQRPL